MNNLRTVASGATHQLYDALLGVARRRGTADQRDERDRGAVSLEQVLWFVAAGLAVAVVAGIIWDRIVAEANNPIDVPDAPASP